MVRLSLTTIVAVLGSLAVSAHARASESCWEKLVADWSDGAIAGVYPVECYRQALSNMPEDIRLYSSATDDINHALADRVQGARSVSMSRTSGVTPAASASDDATLLTVRLVLGGSLALAFCLVGGGVWYLTRRRTPGQR